MKHYLDNKYGTNAPVLRQENQQAIALLDEWFSEPDDMGEEFWLEYDQQIGLMI